MVDKCDIKVRQVDSAMWEAFKASQELDWFIQYKNTHPIGLSDESMAKLLLVNKASDLKWIAIYTKSWIPVAYSKEYYTMRDYIVNYSRSENFMWLFKLLYWEDEQAFKNIQEKIRQDVAKFFQIIEKPRVRSTQQEYFFRLIRLIRDDEYNDAKLFLALFPDAREVITNKWLFENYFGVDFMEARTYRRVRETITREAWIYAFLPEFRALKDGSAWTKWWTMSSHTYWHLLPDDVKVYYFREKFTIPEWNVFREIWSNKEVYWPWDQIYITNDQFMRLSKNDQEILYDLVFDSYKLSNAENAATLEKSIEKSKKSFFRVHAWLTFMSWVWAFYKWISNPIIYAAVLSLYKFPKWLISLLALNSFLHIPRYLANESMWVNFTGSWKKFCRQQWLFKTDIGFWDLIEQWFKQWDYFDSLSYMMIALKREIQKVAEAQFFNVADTAMTAYYRRNLAEEYLSMKYPRINSFDEYSNMLSIMSKRDRDIEVNNFVKYIDDKMYTRYNNSLDTTRYNKNWILLPWKTDSVALNVQQEVVNLLWNMWMFYRRYMVTYADNIVWTVKEWWRHWNSQKQVKELLEQYYWWKKSRDEVMDIVDKTFANNQDLEYLFTTALYSFLMAKTIFKMDIHWNGEDESVVNDWVLLDEFRDLYSLFFFPIEAIWKTWMWMWFNSMFDAITLDLWVWDNMKLIWWYEYKTIAKQMTKSQWLLKWFLNLASDYIHHHWDEWQDLPLDKQIERIVTDLTSTISWFWYYLLDDIEREWFEEYTPKSQTALLKQIFGTREYSIKQFDEINKKQWILKIWDWKTFNNRLVYNTPYVAQRAQWEFSSKEWVQQALKDWYNTQMYHDMADWNMPANVTDSEWFVFYWMMTQYNPQSLEQIWHDFLVDWAWEDEEWVTQHNYEKEAVEEIWHRLMIDNVDPALLKEAIRLLDTAEKWYQAQALTALMYLEAQTPWSWQKLLWYYISSKAAHEVFYSWKYWFFEKMDNWEYSISDKVKQQEAFRQEWIKLAKQYFWFEYILDKEIWAQAMLKMAKDSDLSISEYIKDTNYRWTAALWIYPDKQSVLERKKIEDWDDYRKDTSLYEVYKLHTYATIASAEWMPDWFKLYNMFSKLFSASWKKDDNWKLTENWAKSMLYAYNSLNELLDWYWISNVEKVVLMSSTMLQSDQFIARLIEWKTPEEVQEDPYIQTALHFLWWTAQLVNDLANRNITEVVQKKQTWTDPSDVSLSWVTNSKWTKKSWYSNWKQYYNNNKYLFDQVKYMTSKYHKYYNYLYTPKSTNVQNYYSRKERDAKQFWPAIASIKWSWGGRRWGDKQKKPWWSTTQRWWKARPFTNRWDLDKIPDRRTKPKNRRTRAYAVGSKLRNKLIPWRRRYIKARQRDIPTLS